MRFLQGRFEELDLLIFYRLAHIAHETKVAFDDLHLRIKD